MSNPVKIEMVNQYGRQSVRLAIEQTAVFLEVAEVDAVIEHLGLIRAAMRPAVPKAPSRAHQYAVEVDPCWHSEKHPLYDGTVLFLRHSGLGWTGFALPRHSLVQLNHVLSRHLEALPEVQTLPN